MDNPFVPLLVLAGVAAAIGLVALVVWWARRQSWIKALEAKGWAFESSPTPQTTFGLNVPPFGLGFRRTQDELVTGTTPQGIPFRSFEYAHDGGSEQRAIVVALPSPLPEAHLVTPDRVRPGTAAPQVAQAEDALVLAHDAEWGRAFAGLVGPALAGLRATTGLDLTVDGRHVVALGGSKEPEALAAQVAAVGEAARLLAGPEVVRYATQEPPVEQSFYGRPTWFYRPTDDRYLSTPGVTQAGDNHRTHDLMLTTDGGGVSVIAFRHTWDTHRTESSTDSNGNTTTRTVTDHHEEPVCAIALPFPFGEVSLNWFELFGNAKRHFESIDFDEHHKVRAADGKFASDVFHPRMMEWIMARQPIPFRVEGGYLRFDLGRHDVADVLWCADFAQAFFRRVPEFVWHQLGVQVPSFREVD